MLASAKNLGYNRPAPPKNGVGFDSLNDQRQWPQLEVLRLFSCLSAPFYGASGGGVERLAGSKLRWSPVCQPRLGVPPILTVGGTDSPSDQSENAMQNAVAVHIAVIDGQPTTTTQDIAEVYGKRHDRVIAAVRQRMAEAGEWGVHNFVETTYTNPQNGQTYPVIRMTKKGFHFVVGKFTGSKAVKHQIAFADEFERMEAELANKRLTTEAPYTALPSQKLSAENAAELRLMVQHAAERLPKDKQGAFCIKAWSKLKSHFGVGYRDIPEAQFTDAVSIIGRHIIECVGTAPGLQGSWYLTIDDCGRKTMTQLQWDDCVLKWSDLPKLIAASDNMLPNELVANIAAVASSRLAGSYAR